MAIRWRVRCDTIADLAGDDIQKLVSLASSLNLVLETKIDGVWVEIKGIEEQERMINAIKRAKEKGLQVANYEKEPTVIKPS